MPHYYKEKELSAVNGKIETIIRESNFIQKNIWKVIGFGIIVSLWAPTYSNRHSLSRRKSALDISNLSYYELVLLTAIVFTVICVLTHYSIKYQDGKKLKQLHTRKLELEKELNMVN
ncbi:hypothetical protein NO995_02460 [Aestuariibaculum sp. M13]|uniref:hypothetical protein n=1 Tax=Aestuariibaculum sp. M13 TaxID=2967132 RepID=UPI002159D99A|nr:hypothetical protein [Aestuariibaculum sp. M13]MCR8666527.1 hypothetical protein [Aestuariibaculum sp. M13]